MSTDEEQIDHGTKGIGDYIVTSSGIKFEFPEPTPDMVRLEDIAHGLSNTCRFGGQGHRFYSVGHHSISVYMLVNNRGGSKHEKMQALLHDASEAYLADVPGPAKKHLLGYQELEKKVLSVIGEKLNVNLVGLSDLVKWADRQHLYWEAKQLFTREHIEDWVEKIDSEFLKGRPLPRIPAHQTKEVFMNLYNDIQNL